MARHVRMDYSAVALIRPESGLQRGFYSKHRTKYGVVPWKMARPLHRSVYYVCTLQRTRGSSPTDPESSRRATVQVCILVDLLRTSSGGRWHQSDSVRAGEHGLRKSTPALLPSHKHTVLLTTYTVYLCNTAIHKAVGSQPPRLDHCCLLMMLSLSAGSRKLYAWHLLVSGPCHGLHCKMYRVLVQGIASATREIARRQIVSEMDNLLKSRLCYK
jgi:hypothetical protein